MHALVGVLVRVSGPDPSQSKIRNRSFYQHLNGRTTLSGSGCLVVKDTNELVIITSGWTLAPFMHLTRQQPNHPPTFIDGTTIEFCFEGTVDRPTKWFPCTVQSIVSDPNNKPTLFHAIGAKVPVERSVDVTAVAICTCSLEQVPNSVPRELCLPSFRYNRGDEVFVCSSPFGLVSPNMFHNSHTKGIVANLIPHTGLESQVVVKHSTAPKVQTSVDGDVGSQMDGVAPLILTDARCLPGSEGGAVTSNGHWIGVVAPALYRANTDSRIELDVVIPCAQFLPLLVDVPCAQGLWPPLRESSVTNGGQFARDGGSLSWVLGSSHTLAQSPPTLAQSPPTLAQSPPTLAQSPPTLAQSPPTLARHPQNTTGHFANVTEPNDSPIYPADDKLADHHPPPYTSKPSGSALHTGEPQPLELAPTPRSPDSATPSQADILEHSRQAVCLVEVGTSWGSGVTLSADGYILTCAHVLMPYLDNSTSPPKLSRIVYVSFRESQQEKAQRHRHIADLVFCSQGPIDVAMLKVDAPKHLDGSDLTLRSLPVTSSPAVRQTIFALGHALFHPGSNLTLSTTKGHIAKVVTHDNKPVVLQSSTAVFRGHSGGLLLNDHGEMVGLLTSNARHSDGSIIPTINFSLPVSMFKSMLEMARSGDVNVDDLVTEYNAEFPLLKRLLELQVTDDLLADQPTTPSDDLLATSKFGEFLKTLEKSKL